MAAQTAMGPCEGRRRVERVSLKTHQAWDRQE